MNIFGKKPTAKDALRASKREMGAATRGIEREIAGLQSEEKKLLVEIKRTAKTGNEAAARVLARQLVRLRQQIVNLQGSRAQMRGIAIHTQAMHATTSIASGMKGATKAMTSMNKQLAPAKQMKIMQEFQKQSAQMDMTSEMMSDSIDDALDDDEAEEESDELTNQVLDEIGIDIASQLSSAPKGRLASKAAQHVSRCEAFSTYPRTYDLLHAWTVISDIEKKGCSEMDRILRPTGFIIVRDKRSTVDFVKKYLPALHWELADESPPEPESKEDEVILLIQKKLSQKKLSQSGESFKDSM